MLARQRCWPVTLSTAYRLPKRSGKYTVSPSTAGVADTSPPVVNSHFFWSVATLLGLNVVSPGCDRVFCRSPPAEFHWLELAAALDTPASRAPVTTSAAKPTPAFRGPTGPPRDNS